MTVCYQEDLTLSPGTFSRALYTLSYFSWYWYFFLSFFFFLTDEETQVWKGDIIQKGLLPWVAHAAALRAELTSKRLYKSLKIINVFEFTNLIAESVLLTTDNLRISQSVLWVIIFVALSTKVIFFNS